MTEEFWKSVDVNVDRRLVRIVNIMELEYAGVLATGGFIDSVGSLRLKGVDVSSIPANIINNVVKIVKICLKDVSGWRTSMLYDVKCKEMEMWNTELEPGSNGRPITVYEELCLHNVRGDLSGLFGNLVTDEMVTNLWLRLTLNYGFHCDWDAQNRKQMVIKELHTVWITRDISGILGSVLEAG